MKRRQVLGGMGAGVLVCLQPLPAWGQAWDQSGERLKEEQAQFEQLLAQHFEGRIPVEGNVSVNLPALAENGNSVALEVQADLPVGAARVVSIDVFAPMNPAPHIAQFLFGAGTGRAQVRTRMRLAADQTVRAVASFDNGRLMMGGAHIVVTEVACLDFLI